MAKKNPLVLINKRINKEVVKLSWTYLIVFSLITLGLVQLYTSTTRSSQQQNNTKATVEVLQRQLQEQQKIIDKLQLDVETLKNNR